MWKPRVAARTSKTHLEDPKTWKEKMQGKGKKSPSKLASNSSFIKEKGPQGGRAHAKHRWDIGEYAEPLLSLEPRKHDFDVVSYAQLETLCSFLVSNGIHLFSQHLKADAVTPDRPHINTFIYVYVYIYISICIYIYIYIYIWMAGALQTWRAQMGQSLQDQIQEHIHSEIHWGSSKHLDVFDMCIVNLHMDIHIVQTKKKIYIYIPPVAVVCPDFFFREPKKI